MFPYPDKCCDIRILDVLIPGYHCISIVHFGTTCFSFSAHFCINLLVLTRWTAACLASSQPTSDTLCSLQEWFVVVGKNSNKTVIGSKSSIDFGSIEGQGGLSSLFKESAALVVTVVVATAVVFVVVVFLPLSRK